MTFIKLNLGSGISGPMALNVITMNQSEWKSIDICAAYNPHECYDISNGIKEPDDSIEEIWMGDFFEHLLRLKDIFVIKECFRVLKSGGKIQISVPDMAIIMPKWLESDGENTDYSELIWGDQDGMYQRNSIPSSHFHGYTENSIKKLLTNTGFKDIKRIGIHKHWCELAVEAYK
jgi:predicted SAM-dependent methyltransferase